MAWDSSSGPGPPVTSTSDTDNSLFEAVVSAAAQRRLSRDRRLSRAGQTVYDVLVEATVERLGGWRQVTPEDVVNISREKTVLDTYNSVSSDLKVSQIIEIYNLST